MRVKSGRVLLFSLWNSAAVRVRSNADSQQLTQEQKGNTINSYSAAPGGDTRMADISYYVALPFSTDDDGSIVTGTAEEFQSASTAIRRAETLSRTAGAIGAIAFSRSGDPMTGDFKDATVLKSFGHVPVDLSGL